MTPRELQQEPFNRVDELPTELRKRIEALEARVAKLEKCCPSYPNGPQWGHEWSCPKCPD